MREEARGVERVVGHGRVAQVGAIEGDDVTHFALAHCAPQRFVRISKDARGGGALGLRHLQQVERREQRENRHVEVRTRVFDGFRFRFRFAA